MLLHPNPTLHPACVAACNPASSRLRNGAICNAWRVGEGAPTVLLAGEHAEENSCMVFYGTDNGILGQLFLGRTGGYTGWTLTNVTSPRLS